MMGKINVAKGFSPLSAKQWKQQLQYDLKGADYQKTLLWESPDGIHVKPFYNSEDLEKLPSYKATGQRGWKIGQAIEAKNTEEANRKGRHALANGAESLHFMVRSEQLNPVRLLEGIDLTVIPVHFTFGFLSADYLNSLLSQIPVKAAGVFLHLDPIGQLVRTGNWFQHQKEDIKQLLSISGEWAGHGSIFPIGVHADSYLNAGATIVQQLAYALAHANEYLNVPDGPLKTPPVFTMAIGSDYFFEIAKLRAMRLLWDTLSVEYMAPIPCHILAVPCRRNKTLYDYNMNMLRTSSECMSAALGGADTIVNLRYDYLFKEPNEFGERMARNQLLLLKHEAHFNAVDNPADGAYFIEAITFQLAQKALELFKQLEAGGGFLKQLGEHHIQKKVRESATREQDLFSQGKRILVGTNAYRLEGERMKEQLEKSPFTKGKKIKTLIEPLSLRRLSASMEEKRLADE